MTGNRKGSALVMVMLFTFVITLLGTAILGVAINEYRMEAAHRDSVKAYYLAEAGLEKAVYEISQMEAIVPGTLKDKQWEMESEDLGLVKPGARGDYLVTVEYVELVDVILAGEGESSEVYKTIYEIKLKSIAVYKEAPAGIETHILVEDYEETGMDNRVEVSRWRQVRGVEDEN
ncbi:MAG TPA: pilus assembly PilX N-terminal domain-containing protein [Clostridia bacterium]|nr:pilus assembly PilX N-terminal domain-containing protein [Clostridia bacterium]